jgi:hypothetical protein
MKVVAGYTYGPNDTGVTFHVVFARIKRVKKHGLRSDLALTGTLAERDIKA